MEETYAWEATGDGDKFVIRLLLQSGEHIEYELPHMPASTLTEDGMQYWWREREVMNALASTVVWFHSVYGERLHFVPKADTQGDFFDDATHSDADTTTEAISGGEHMAPRRHVSSKWELRVGLGWGRITNELLAKS